MDKDMPADWAIERAIELVNVDGSTYTHESLTQDHIGGWSLGKAFARYIEAHEQPPVDPDLETARAIMSDAMIYAGKNRVGQHGHYETARNFKDGTLDSTDELRFALAKLKEARGK